MGWKWIVDEISNSGHLIQCTFRRPCTEDGAIGIGYGRRWYIETTDDEKAILMTAWLAVQQIVTHELLEAFAFTNPMYPGDHIRVFDPHKPLDTLLFGGRPIPRKN